VALLIQREHDGADAWRWVRHAGASVARGTSSTQRRRDAENA
jgi:hypothetical protein